MTSAKNNIKICNTDIGVRWPDGPMHNQPLHTSVLHSAAAEINARASGAEAIPPRLRITLNNARSISMSPRSLYKHGQASRRETTSWPICWQV